VISERPDADVVMCMDMNAAMQLLLTGGGLETVGAVGHWASCRFDPVKPPM